MKNIRLVMSLLLVTSMVLLTILVPGGPIETRDFSHINPLILGGFNIFLTSTGIISLLIIYFILKKHKWADFVSFLCGLSYFLVYVLDLGKIFPVSPTAMPKTLYLIEIIGSILSLPLMFLSIKLFLKSNTDDIINNRSKLFLPIVIIMILLGIGIVIFATKSAMRR